MSYNVKGLNSIKKHWLALKELNSGADVVLVQETHFCSGGSFKFASKYFPTSNVTSTGKAEVVVLIQQPYF